MRSAEASGPDPLSNGGNAWSVKVDGIVPDSPGGMTAEEVQALVQPANPGAIATASTRYQTASDKLAAHADALRGHMARVAGIWTGGPAEQAMQQMQQLHETASGIARDAAQVSSALSAHVQPLADAQNKINDYVAQKKALAQQLSDAQWKLGLLTNPLAGFVEAVAPGGSALADWEEGRLRQQIAGLEAQMRHYDDLARKELANLSGKTIETYDALPPSFTKNLPKA